MGKFNKAQREIVGCNCIAAIHKPSAPKQVSVTCGSKEAGEAVASVISAAYPQCKLYKTQNILGATAGNLILAPIVGPLGVVQFLTDNWKAFTVKCTSKSKAEDLQKEISSCIEEYGGAVEGGGSAYEGTDTDTGAGSRLSTKTIVIIGAVLAVVLAIVLTRKKKK